MSLFNTELHELYGLHSKDNCKLDLGLKVLTKLIPVIGMDSITRSNWLKGAISLICYGVIPFPTFFKHTLKV